MNPMSAMERALREQLGLPDDVELPEQHQPQDVGPLPIGKADPRGPFGARSLGEDFGPYTGNVYFYWFQYMREYPAYAARLGISHLSEARRVIREFEIKEDDEFASWWDRKGEDLFYDLYEDESHAFEVARETKKRDLGDGLLVYLPIDGNIADMLNEVEQMFQRKRRALSGKYPELFRKYALHQGRYTVSSLHNKLEIYRAMIDHTEALKTKEIRLYDIFYKIADKLIISRGFRNVTNEAASRTMIESFDLACRLLHHVGQGRFPDYSLPPTRYDPRSE